MRRSNNRNRNHRGYRGQGRGAGQRSQGVFYKLLKDENAKMRSRDDALRFIFGMESFESKAELLGLLDDNRYAGPVSLFVEKDYINLGNENGTILVNIFECIPFSIYLMTYLILPLRFPSPRGVSKKLCRPLRMLYMLTPS